MRSINAFLSALLSLAFTTTPTAAQTWSSCNPLTQGGCPPDAALGKTVHIDFTDGASDSFAGQGNPTYDSNGASFTVAQSGDSPQLTSIWYIMFGRVEISLKAAPGAGIVSSVVLQSDCLDEIDWEWLGADPDEVQTNYFGKGQTGTYNRGAFHSDPGSQDGFKTYTIDWTPEQIVWQIDGVTVRALRPDDAAGQYPQTPMQIKMGAWSGGDSSNSPGTIEWARGPTDYSQGPFTMQVQSIMVADYSTGTQYVYSGTSGNWQDIEAVDGSVNSGGSTESVDTDAPAVTESSSGQPIPFQGTHQDDSSTYVTPSEYPWVPRPTTMETSTVTATSYPGLPSGWTVSDSGKVIPPSAAPSLTASPVSSPALSQPAPSSAAAPDQPAGGYEVITTYDQQGFTTLLTVPAGHETMPRVYDSQGFLVTDAPAAPQSTGTADAAAAENIELQNQQEGDQNDASSGLVGLGAEFKVACAAALVAALVL
ncbi:concanavalin A-like lectin/glucanase domain-containing protein [Lineolata rhizophorae]|uniref:chitinase n=1 Tax=Lineolata rhizophorae TaxID=578093 RepID=A0A6A6P0R4_9PEZI|nr:concanavalin A-like lectin/glucanase domain-containing protein [Lineolata rhizophorae]